MNGREERAIKRLYVIDDPYQDITVALEYEGGELVTLIVMNPQTLATNMERELEERKRLALRIAQARASRRQHCEFRVEWGTRDEVVRNSLVREGAELL